MLGITRIYVHECMYLCKIHHPRVNELIKYQFVVREKREKINQWQFIISMRKLTSNHPKINSNDYHVL